MAPAFFNASPGPVKVIVSALIVRFPVIIAEPTFTVPSALNIVVIPAPELGITPGDQFSAFDHWLLFAPVQVYVWALIVAVNAKRMTIMTWRVGFMPLRYGNP